MGSPTGRSCPTPEVVRAIILHPLVDLSTAWPPFFVENLRQIFMHGIGKSGSKFRALRDQIVQSLPSAPPPGPATFMVKCLDALLHVRPPHDEGLSHLLISALCESDRSNWPPEDASIARRLAASLFCNALAGNVRMESRIVVKLPVVFGLELKDIGGTLGLGQCEEEAKLKAAKEFVERYILDLLKIRSYTGAVSLLKSFNLQRCDYQGLVAAIADDGQTSLAVDWAAHLGKEMLKFLVQHCIETGLFKVAYKTVQHYKLEQDFPDAYYLYRQSSLRKLVNKGMWDVAESIAEEDSQLVEYLLNLALEDNDAEKVTELCERFQLDHVPISSEPVNSKEGKHYLQLESLVSEENVHWIDTHEGLAFAERNLIGVKVVGIDCEWKANIVRGSGPSKVSILQVASSELVFVFDLITLSKKYQNTLNGFVKALFHAPNILKLGYAVHYDLERLLHSYKEIEAFRVCESVLDLQRVFGRQIKGGLSGLAKDVLGNYLNKKTRMSDWESRPLSKKQLHYAALDAAVLLPIYDSISSHTQPLMPKAKEWKSHVTSFRVMSKHKEQSDVLNIKSHEPSSNRRTSAHSHEDLVLATCELLGLPIPGLMKAELFHFTKAARLPPPVYTATSLGPLNDTAYYSTVKVAGTTFSGCLASSKKDAEFWAAQVALTKLNAGAADPQTLLAKLDSKERKWAQKLLSTTSQSRLNKVKWVKLPMSLLVQCVFQAFRLTLEDEEYLVHLKSRSSSRTRDTHWL